MGTAHKAVFRSDQLRIEGASRAGDRTWFRVHPPGLAFDVGRGALELTGSDQIFLTHGHLDHALGLPFVLSNRVMQGLGATRVHCPIETRAALEAFVEAAAALERVEYDYSLQAMEPGDRVDVGRDFLVEAFAVDHGVPALGYHLVRKAKSLAFEHRGLPGVRLAELRKKGVDISTERDDYWLSYCGDTSRRVFELEPRVFESRVLLVECTFFDHSERERAPDYGHLHLEDLVSLEDRFENEAVILHHLTRRHRPDELRRAVDSRLPELAERIHLLMVSEP
ncbi:MAG: MBL fold metallo-hydrolase [Acidobacteriota bacterium]|nr:MBL fold metallo-hydrolase [Acidobacteriota bacterium]